MKVFASFQGRTFGLSPGLCPGPMRWGGGFKAAIRRPVQKILDPALWFPHVAIRKVPLQYSQSKTHHFVVMVVVEGFHFICHILFVYVFALHRILYIPGGFWKWIPPLINVGPRPPLWKTKVDSPPPLKAKLNGIELSLLKIPGSAPAYNQNIYSC
jgi:hypothetical protein